jgi:hypothetical protein
MIVLLENAFPVIGIPFSGRVIKCFNLFSYLSKTAAYNF